MNIFQSLVALVKPEGPRVPVDTTPVTDVEGLEALVQHIDRQIGELRERKRAAAAELRKAIDARNAKNMADALRQAQGVSVRGQVLDVTSGV